MKFAPFKPCTLPKHVRVEILHREFPVKNLYFPCKGLQCLYKQLYKVGKTQKIQPYFLYLLVSDRAFDAASVGYLLYKDADLKMDAVNFAKAAEKFGKFVGDAVVTRGKPNYCKEIYQDYEKWLQIPTLQK
jgi:hypothetical protein